MLAGHELAQAGAVEAGHLLAPLGRPVLQREQVTPVGVERMRRHGTLHAQVLEEIVDPGHGGGQDVGMHG